MVSRAAAEAMDAADPLARLRRRFGLADDLVYLDGNSLGAPPVTVASALAALQDEWARDLIGGWDGGWWEAPVTVGEKIAPLLGAAPGQVVVTDSTSVNFYKLLVGALRLRPDRSAIATVEGNFPTDRYLIEEVARQWGARVDERPAAEAASIGTDTAVLTLTHVDYRSGAMHDLPGLTSAAHDVGALVLWDLSHSVGAMPLSLDAAGVDLAVGCSYKYLNGGPGAPAWCYVAHRHQGAIESPLPGWLSHAEPFAMADRFRPSAGMRRLLTGTPPMLSLRALDAALDVFAVVTMASLRHKSLALGDLFIALADDRLTGLGFAVITPRPHGDRGSQVSLCRHDAADLLPRLAARGVIADHRPPDVLRFGLAPLYVRFVDVWDAVERLATLGEPLVGAADSGVGPEISPEISPEMSTGISSDRP